MLILTVSLHPEGPWASVSTNRRGRLGKVISTVPSSSNRKYSDYARRLCLLSTSRVTDHQDRGEEGAGAPTAGSGERCEVESAKTKCQSVKWASELSLGALTSQGMPSTAHPSQPPFFSEVLKNTAQGSLLGSTLGHLLKGLR